MQPGVPVGHIDEPVTRHINIGSLGGERDVLIVDNSKPTLSARTERRGSESDVMGQFGGGLEFRFTRHLGWMNDFSWNIVEGPDNNFGMVRSGLTFSF